jgi:hypothetical protein
MNIPSLPTDNLYKFLALAGLALMAFGVVYPLAYSTELGLKVAEVETEVDVLQIDVADLQQQRASLEKQSNPSSEESSALRKQDHEVCVKLVQIKGELEQLTTLNLSLQIVRSFLRPGMYFGLGTSLFGFLLWYLKFQRLSDKILRKQLEDTRS